MAIRTADLFKGLYILAIGLVYPFINAVRIPAGRLVRKYRRRAYGVYKKYQSDEKIDKRKSLEHESSQLNLMFF